MHHLKDTRLKLTMSLSIYPLCTPPNTSWYLKNLLNTWSTDLELVLFIKDFTSLSKTKYKSFWYKLKQSSIFIILPPYACPFDSFKTMNKAKTRRISLILRPKSASCDFKVSVTKLRALYCPPKRSQVLNKNC